MERLSGLDASFLYMETRTMQMQVAFIVIADPAQIPGGYSFRQMARLLDSRTQQHRAFRRRLVEVPFQLHHPVWIDDPDFNIMHHLYQYTLPAPGSLRDLGAMIGHIISKPMDRQRPLWQAWAIEGLENGRIALVLKFHHAAVDGVSGTSLIRQLFDTQPLTELPAVTARSTGEPVPSDGELVMHALRSRLRDPRRFVQLVSESAQGLSQWVRKDKAETELPRSGPMMAPRTHFNARIGTQRDVALTKLSLKNIKAVKNATGATVNDVILAICGGALRHYLQEKNDLPVKPLITMVPISVRKPDQMQVTNNHVSGMWATLATHVEDPLERLRLISQDTAAAKQGIDAVGADLLQDWAEFNTPGAFNLAVRLYTSSGLVDLLAPVHNTIISNVPGPREPLYLAGAKIDAIIPLGPVMEGVGLNISLASYQDCVGFCINADSELIDDVGVIAEWIQASFAELQQAAGTASTSEVPDQPRRAVQ